MERQSGILMPIFSLPSKYGIGDFGKQSYAFVDYLKSAGQKVWQILPLVQTGYGNSPYSSISAKSFNPYFISPELLVEEGLLKKSEIEFSISNSKYIDYSELYAVRYPMLRKAFSRFNKKNTAFQKYVKSGESRYYALFMALKYASGQKHFYEWEDKYKYMESSALNKFEKTYSEEIYFWQFVQFIAKKQWLDLKKYANKNGISIIGDMPLYVALDSVDVWVNPHLYKLNSDFSPKKVAGVPPDYFCEDGQLWGNPVYDYDEHKKDKFSWWCNRIKDALSIYDYVRIDHFRGLDRYYEIDTDAPNARFGVWVDVPHDELFSALHERVDRDRIIAEDLGIIDDGVRELLRHTGYPGMKILSFAFNGDENNLYLPKNIQYNSICYTGTHDNDTLRGLIASSNEWDYANIKRGVSLSLFEQNVKGNTDDIDALTKSIIELGMASKSKLFIMPWQDVLMFDSSYRINEPGSIKSQNWAVKFTRGDFKKCTAEKLNKLTKKYSR